MKKSKFKTAKFLTLLKSTEQPDGRHSLDAPLLFYSAILNKYETVDEGFDTDFCSVPRFPFIYAVMGGRFNKIGALHDKLYRFALYPRCICDLVLREGIIAEDTDENVKKVIGEIADVKNCIEQLEYIFGHEAIAKIKAQKEARLFDKICRARNERAGKRDRDFYPREAAGAK